MATLKCAEDGHLYLMLGKSMGDRQIREEGIRWLKENLREPLPKRGSKGIELRPDDWKRMESQDWLFKKGIEYEKRDSSYSQEDSESVADAFPKGLPLLLHWNERFPDRWRLKIDLAPLGVAANKELDNEHASKLAIAGAFVSAVSRYEQEVAVRPQAEPYSLCWLNAAGTSTPLESAEAPLGLDETWAGTVFAEMEDRPHVWRRLPGSATSYQEEFLWLGRTDQTPDWPDTKEPIGQPENGWQLWRLSFDAQQPLSLESIKKWLWVHSLKLTPYTQRLRLISPPSAVRVDLETNHTYYQVSPQHSLIFGCLPPLREMRTIGSSRLVITPLDELVYWQQQSTPPSKRRDRSHKIEAPFDEAGRIAYVRWAEPQPGKYRVQIKGDTVSSPVLLEVLETSTTGYSLPAWLHGMVCHIGSASRGAKICSAFHVAGIADTQNLDIKHSLSLQDWSPEEAEQLGWSWEPQGLPVIVRWHGLREGMNEVNQRYVATPEHLTRLWQEEIWPLAEQSGDLEITLDGAAFGSITLVIYATVKPQALEAEPPLPVVHSGLSRRQEQWVIWLSCQINQSTDTRMLPLPGQIREHFQHLFQMVALNREGASSPFSDTRRQLLATAIYRLSSTRMIPAWLLPHLYRLAPNSKLAPLAAAIGNDRRRFSDRAIQ